MNSSIEAADNGGARREGTLSKICRRIPFATVAGAICFLTGTTLFWPLGSKFEKGITQDPHNPDKNLEILHIVSMRMLAIYSFMVFLEILTVLISCACTGPARNAYFGTLRSQIAGRIFCGVLLAFHCLVLYGVYTVALAASHLWRHLRMMNDRVLDNDDCLLYGRRSGNSWKEERICEESKLIVFRSEMQAYTHGLNEALLAMFILACAEVMNIMVLVVNFARIKNQVRNRTRATRHCETGETKDEEIRADEIVDCRERDV